LESEQLGIVLNRIVLLWRFGLRAVLVGGAELTKLQLPVVLESYEAEDEAVARLAGELRSRDQAG
jgi:hypothetical protein